LEELHYFCRSCINRHVRVSTVDGRVHEGVLLHFDGDNIYLDGSAAFISNKVSIKGFRSRNFITTLVLFDILAIALIA
jgi:small nuclear ribonucleoprotein (snRNP)-like protein